MITISDTTLLIIGLVLSVLSVFTIWGIWWSDRHPEGFHLIPGRPMVCPKCGAPLWYHIRDDVAPSGLTPVDYSCTGCGWHITLPPDGVKIPDFSEKYEK